MTCPTCQSDVPPEPIVYELTVCPTCARSLVMDGDEARLATREDLAHLNDAQLKALRKARPKEWRDAQTAAKARIKGR